MNAPKLLAALLAALVVVTGTAAAVPGNAPVDTGANDSDAAGDRGPPADLPSQVPDHVSAIHDLIRQHLSGGLDGSLGDAISAVTPGDEAAGDENTVDSEDEAAAGDADAESAASDAPAESGNATEIAG